MRLLLFVSVLFVVDVFVLLADVVCCLLVVHSVFVFLRVCDLLTVFVYVVFAEYLCVFVELCVFVSVFVVFLTNKQIIDDKQTNNRCVCLFAFYRCVHCFVRVSSSYLIVGLFVVDCLVDCLFVCFFVVDCLFVCLIVCC